MTPFPSAHLPPLGQLHSQPTLCFAPNWPPHWHTAVTFRRSAFGRLDLRKRLWRKSGDGCRELHPFIAIVGFYQILVVHTDCQPHVGRRFKNRRPPVRFSTQFSPSYMETSPPPVSFSSPSPLNDAFEREMLLVKADVRRSFVLY